MKKKLIVSNTLFVVFLAIFLYYFTRNYADFRALFNLNIYTLVTILILLVISIYINGQFNRHALTVFNKHISRSEGFKVALLTSVGNYFGPFLGGVGIRAVYLKKKFNLAYSDFLSTVYAYYLIVFLTSAVCGLLSLALLKNNSSENGYYLLLPFFILVLAVITFLSNGINQLKISKKIIKFKNPLMKRSKLTATLFYINIASFTSLALINYLEFTLLGVHMSLGQLMLYTVLGSFSLLISVTPGALGIREAIYMYSSAVIGVTNKEILAVALIDRTLLFVVMVCGWVAVTFFAPKNNNVEGGE